MNAEKRLAQIITSAVANGLRITDEGKLFSIRRNGIMNVCVHYRTRNIPAMEMERPTRKGAIRLLGKVLEQVVGHGY
jgi:hypothetical protein